MKRVAATDTFVAYAPELEDVIFPQAESLKRAMMEVAAFSFFRSPSLGVY